MAGPACGYSPFAATQADACGKLLDYFSKKGIAYTKVQARVTFVSIGGEAVADQSPAGIDKALAAAGYDLARVRPSAERIAVILVAILVLGALSGDHLWPGRGAACRDVSAGDPLFVAVDPLSFGHWLFRWFLPFISQYVVAKTGDPSPGCGTRWRSSRWRWW